jgi:hypothetical protein
MISDSVRLCIAAQRFNATSSDAARAWWIASVNDLAGDGKVLMLSFLSLHICYLREMINLWLIDHLQQISLWASYIHSNQSSCDHSVLTLAVTQALIAWLVWLAAVHHTSTSLHV